MATFRVGVGSFNINDGAVGIGTEISGLGNLGVDGTTKVIGSKVSGASTLTRYSGFAADNINQLENITLTSEVGTIGDIVVGVGTSVIISSASTVTVGTVESVSIGTHFSPPVGGIEERGQDFVEGMIRFNTDLNTMEFYNGNEWRQFTYQSAAQNSFSSRGRGFMVGGFEPGVGHTEITYFDTSTRGNTQSFGYLSFAHYSTNGGFSSQTRGLAGGSGPATDTIEYFTMASTGNGIDFGNMSDGRGYSTGASSSTRGLFAAGYNPSLVNTIDYVEIGTLGNALDFGDLSATRVSAGGCSTPVRAVFIGGGTPSPYANSKFIDFVIISSKGNSVDFGGVFGTGVDSTSSHSNHTRAITAAGKSDGAYATEITSGGNSFYFADLVEPNRESCFNTGNMVRGVITGGYPAYNMRMEEVMIASGGSSTDFGERHVNSSDGSSCSDSHGGLGGY